MFDVLRLNLCDFFQMSEAMDSSGATLQMQTSEDGMSLPVTLAVEDGQLVAHIPTSSEFIKVSTIYQQNHFNLLTLY